MDKHEPSTIKHRRYWSGIKAADGIMAAFSKRNAQLLQPHNPRERNCTQRLKKAFTHAEVLITLSIIGVAAALTIPTLIQRTGDEEMVSKLMKAYSTLSQATEAIITEQGSPKVWNTSHDTLYEAYKSHLRNAKECNSGSGCFKQLANKGYKWLNGAYHPYNHDTNQNYRKLILSDGVQVSFKYSSNECKTNDDGTKDLCAFVAVDLNGAKEPNIIGRDVFGFSLKETGLYPSGCDYDGFCKNADGTFGTGWGCACKVLQEGKIDY